MLEVLVAIGLLASIFGLLAVATSGIMKTWERIQAKSGELNALMSLDRTLDSIIGNCIPFTWPDDDRNEALVFDGEPEDMTLAYVHRLNRLEDGAIRFCRFRLEDHEFVVYYSERPPFPDDLGSPRLRRTVLAQQLREIEISYADIEDEALVFNDSWQDKSYLPLAVQLRLTWEDGREESWLRRCAGAGYFERWGTPKREL